MNQLTIKTTNSLCCEDSPSRSAPLPEKWTAYGRLMDKSDVPDLLSDYHDEDVERFMTLPTTRNTFSPHCSPLPRNKKRTLSNADDQDETCNGSPTKNRRRIQDNVESSEEEQLRQEVVQWLHENLGRNSNAANIDSQSQEQERAMMLQQEWNENHSQDYEIPPPIPLQRQDRIHHDKVPPEILRREAALVDSTDENHHPARAHFSPNRKSRFETKTGHVELYPGKKIKIHGMDRAFKSLENGNAAIYECIGCRGRLLAGQGTKLLFCTGCGTLTPTEIKGELKGSGRYENVN